MKIRIHNIINHCFYIFVAYNLFFSISVRAIDRVENSEKQNSLSKTKFTHGGKYEACYNSLSPYLEKNKSHQALQLEYQNYSKGTSHPYLGFAHAVSMRKSSQSNEQKAISEVWFSQSLLSMGLYPIAFHTLESTLKTNPEIPASLKSTIEDCIYEIYSVHPGLKIDREIYEHTSNSKLVLIQLEDLMSDQVLSYKEKIEQIRKLSLKHKTNNTKTNSEIDYLISFYLAVLGKDYDQTIKLGLQILMMPMKATNNPQMLADYIHIHVARAYYSSGQFEKSVPHYQAVGRTSNILPQSLVELAWAHLMSEKYQDAIGSGLSLNVSILKNTFAPESLMVMAMAYNEMCLYPDSLRAISKLTTNYKDTHQWLMNYIQTPKSQRPALYGEVLNALRRKSPVPNRLSGEWIRSSHFLTRQNEINNLVDIKDLNKFLRAQRIQVQLKTVKEIRNTIQAFLPRYLKMKSALPLGAAPPSGMIQEMDAILAMAERYHTVKTAAPLFNRTLKFAVAQSVVRKNKIISEINFELARTTEQMAQLLEEVADNAQFIRAEIYNEAGQDIIYKNANSEEAQTLSATKDGSDKARTPSSSVWNWGRVEGELGDNTEVWDDEVGNLQANITNRCHDSDRFDGVKDLVSNK